MPIENLNAHTHDAGFLQRDWDYFTDESVDIGAQGLAAAASDGLDAQEVVNFIKSGIDLDQVTDREARQISAQLRNYSGQMTGQAQQVADQFESTFLGRVNNLHDCRDETLSGSTHGGWFGPNLHNGTPDAPVLEGAELASFVDQIESTANPFRQLNPVIDSGILTGWSHLRG
jgi:hypothetical protein